MLHLLNHATHSIMLPHSTRHYEHATIRNDPAVVLGECETKPVTLIRFLTILTLS